MEEIYKIIAATVGIFGIGKIIILIFSERRKKLYDEYKFAKEFLNDISSKVKMHSFAIEKGYKALAGSSRISADEVAYILTLKNPVDFLQDYVYSRIFLNHISRDSSNKVTFKKKYESEKTRKLFKIWYMAVYAITAYIAISPAVFAQALKLNQQEVLLYLLFSFPIFGFYAVYFINLLLKLKTAEDFVRNQKTSIETIIVPTEDENS